MSRRREMHRAWQLMCVFGMFVVPGGSVLAVSCGDVLTDDLKLEGDLSCSGTALIVGADGITIDLNGHTLTSLDGLGAGVDATGGYDGVTIKNGTISGFQKAIWAREASDLSIEEVVVDGVSGEGTVPGQLGVLGAIFVEGGEHVAIKDSWIYGVPNFGPAGPGPDAILLFSVSDATVKNVEIDGGFSGVDFASCGEPWLDPDCPPLEEQAPTTGTVKDCILANNVIGVFLINAKNVTVKNNLVSGASQGIRVGLTELVPVSDIVIKENEIFEGSIGIAGLRTPQAAPGPIQRVVIKENSIHDNGGAGVFLFNTDDSQIKENVVSRNGGVGVLVTIGSSDNTIKENLITENGVAGIAVLRESNDNQVLKNTVLGNALDGISLFAGASTGNTIRGNTSLGHGNLDMLHNPEATPNLWVDNCFETSDGADIGDPECEDDDG